jgi:hypothetical protein
MNTIQTITTGILAVLIFIAILIQVLTWLSHRRRDQAARAWLVEHPLPGRRYEVGSPEHNAQIVDAVRTINERIAAQGKRIPERTAIDIIRQTTGSEE